MLDLIVPRGLEHAQMAGQIGLLVGKGVLNRIANSGLGGQVDNPLGAAVAHQGRQGLGVGDVHSDHAKIGAGFQPGRAGGLERRIVIGVEVVDADDGFASIQQALDGVHTDEAGGPCHNHGHGRFLEASGPGAKPRACRAGRVGLAKGYADPSDLWAGVPGRGRGATRR